MIRSTSSALLAASALALTACGLPQADDTPASMDVPPTAAEINGAQRPLLCTMEARPDWTVAPDAKGQVSLGDTTLYAYTDGPFDLDVDEASNLVMGVGDPGTVFVFTNLADGTVSVNINDAGEPRVRALSSPGGEPYCEAAEASEG